MPDPSLLQVAVGLKCLPCFLDTPVCQSLEAILDDREQGAVLPPPVFDARHPAERPFPFRAGHLTNDVRMLGSVISEERFDRIGLFFLKQPSGKP